MILDLFFFSLGDVKDFFSTEYEEFSFSSEFLFNDTGYSIMNSSHLILVDYDFGKRVGASLK